MPYNLAITSLCNLSCEYCFAKEILSEAKTEISIKNTIKVLDFFKKSNHLRIGLIGGEPSLHTQFKTIVKMFLDANFIVSMKSNGLWSPELSHWFSTLPKDQLNFLLNLNEPTFYSKNQWDCIISNLNVINPSQIFLSLNIDNKEFEFEYILDLARKHRIRYLRWSFAHPIVHLEEKKIHQSFFPLSEYKSIAPRVMQLIEKAHESSIRTLGDHSIILCMFDSNQLRRIMELGGVLNSKCEGTIDILPDLRIIYCLPMNSLFKNIYLSDFSVLYELENYFESRIRNLRLKAMPFDDCASCKYFTSKECHGGCLSHRVFDNIDLMEIREPWSIKGLLNETPFLVSGLKRLYQNDRNSKVNKNKPFVVVQNSTGNQFEISEEVYSFLNEVDGNSTFREILARYRSKWNSVRCQDIDKLINFCRTFDIIRLPVTKNDSIIN